MKRYSLLVAGLFLVGNGAVLLMYRGVVRGSHLFVTAGTVRILGSYEKGHMLES